MGRARQTLFAFGALVAVLGAAMLAPALTDLSLGRADWRVFGVSALLFIFLGGAAAALSFGGARRAISTRQTLLFIVGVWACAPAVAAAPILLSIPGLSVTDAYFEAMSALTTTGATVLVGLDDMPPGLLLWRSMLQWFGGVGIVMTAVAILPQLGIGGLQLFRLEFASTMEKLMPRAQALAAAIVGLYAGLTVLCGAAYGFAGMGAFDAVNHAMTTVATGGMSTRDASIGAFQSTSVDFVAAVFMTVGGLPFFAFIAAARRGPLALARDPQIPVYIAMVAGASGLIAIILITRHGYGEADAVRTAFVNAISIITGTGYATAAYDQWGGAAQMMFFSFMFWGACAGSTSCSVKLFRYQVMASELWTAARRALHPHAVSVARYGGRPISQEVSTSVFAFFGAYVGLFWLFAAILGGIGLDPLTALSTAASALSNVGPALGPIAGPTGTYQPLPDPAKWVLSLAMLCGRLEVMPILALLRPVFWRG